MTENTASNGNTDAYNAYMATVRTHSEMLEEAKKIHPDMKVRFGADGETWEFYMPTTFTENHELPQKYEGTPAWECYKSRDSSYDNELERYRYKQGYQGMSLEGVAELINLKEEEQKWARPVIEKLMEEQGVSEEMFSQMWKDNPTTEEEIDKSNEIFSKYQNCRREAGKMMTAEFEAKWAALRDKWDM